MKLLVIMSLLTVLATPAFAQYGDEYSPYGCYYGRCGRGGDDYYDRPTRSRKRDRGESYRERRDREIYNEQRGWRRDDPRGRRHYRDY